MDKLHTLAESHRWGWAARSFSSRVFFFFNWSLEIVSGDSKWYLSCKSSFYLYTVILVYKMNDTYIRVWKEPLVSPSGPNVWYILALFLHYPDSS